MEPAREAVVPGCQVPLGLAAEYNERGVDRRPARNKKHRLGAFCCGPGRRADAAGVGELPPARDDRDRARPAEQERAAPAWGRVAVGGWRALVFGGLMARGGLFSVLAGARWSGRSGTVLLVIDYRRAAIDPALLPESDVETMRRCSVGRHVGRSSRHRTPATGAGSIAARRVDTSTRCRTSRPAAAPASTLNSHRAPSGPANTRPAIAPTAHATTRPVPRSCSAWTSTIAIGPEQEAARRRQLRPHAGAGRNRKRRGGASFRAGRGRHRAHCIPRG